MKQIIRESKNPILHKTDCVKRYLNEIQKIELFKSPEEEHECAIKMINGCHSSRKEIVTRNLRFVIKVASQYTTHDSFIGELIAEGSRGMYEATFKYDPSRGVKFISYAIWWVRLRIVDRIALSRVIKLPINIVNTINNFKKELNDEIQRTDGYLSSEFLEANSKYIDIISKFDTNNIVQLDEPIYIPNNYSRPQCDSERSSLLCGDIDPTESLKILDEKNMVLMYLDILTPRERKVITFIYGLENGIPLSTASIAEKIGVSRQTIQNIKRKSIKKMKNLNTNG